VDLKSTLLHEHSKENANKIAQYVGNNPNRFKQLVKVYLTGPYRVTQRASWPLSICAENHPALVSPHLRELLMYLKRPGVSDAVKRNTVRMLQFIDIPTRYHSQVIDISFHYLQGKKEAVAVKVFSMTVLARLLGSQPELARELRIISIVCLASAGFVSRAKKILKGL
jgi:hypothetical protein